MLVSLRRECRDKVRTSLQLQVSDGVASTERLSEATVITPVTGRLPTRTPVTFSAGDVPGDVRKVHRHDFRFFVPLVCLRHAYGPRA